MSVRVLKTNTYHQDPDAFAVGLGNVDANTVKGIVVNFVSRTLLWGAWVNHHFYAIVREPDTLSTGDTYVNDESQSCTADSGWGGQEGGGREGKRRVGENICTAELQGSRSPKTAAGDCCSLGSSRERTSGQCRRSARLNDLRATKQARVEAGNAENTPRGDEAAKIVRNRVCSTVGDRIDSNNNSNSNSGDLTSSAVAPHLRIAGTAGGGGREKGMRGEEGEGAAIWYNLDSRLPGPLRLGGTAELLEHLTREARDHRGHVFVVSQGSETSCELARGENNNTVTAV